MSILSIVPATLLSRCRVNVQTWAIWRSPLAY
jgi:hypothetical protein